MGIAEVLAGERSWWVEQSDCLAALRSMPDASVAACVTDPPGGIGFMGKAWDTFGRSNPNAERDRTSAYDAVGKGASPFSYSGSGRGANDRDRFVTFLTDVFREVWRILLPGAHALVWAIPRTSHWTATR